MCVCTLVDFLCLCVCLRMCVCVCLCAFIRERLRMYLCVCLFICACVCVCVLVDVCVCVCIYMFEKCMFVFLCVCLRMHVRLCLHVFVRVQRANTSAVRSMYLFTTFLCTLCTRSDVWYACTSRVASPGARGSDGDVGGALPSVQPGGLMLAIRTTIHSFGVSASI